jgi:hypothetical protein
LKINDAQEIETGKLLRPSERKQSYGYNILTTISDGQTFGDEEGIYGTHSVKKFKAVALNCDTQIYKIDRKKFLMS